MKHKIIYISREFGSGGHEIGEIISKTLNFQFYDTKLVDLAAGIGTLSHESAKEFDERGVNPWLFSSVYTGSYQDIAQNSEPELLFKYISQVVREKAAKKNCIFVGRCADYMLRDSDVDLVRIFIYAPEEWRIKRLIQTEGYANEREARNEMRKKDRRRKDYCSYFTGEDFYNLNTYDLCVNSSYLGIERTAFSLCDYCNYVFKGYN